MKFIILTHGRCGSNLLWRSLNRHPDLTVWKDVFNRSKWGPLCESVCCIREPKDVFDHCDGCSVHHSDNKYMPDLFSNLGVVPELHVIFLQRNLLTRLVSWELSQRTGHSIHKGYGDIQLTLNPEQVLENFVELDAMQKMGFLWFRYHPIREVLYEDLCKNWNGEIGRIQEFLGVKVCPLTPAISKQDDKPLRYRLTNYEEIRKYISKTPWKRVFEEIDEQTESE